MLRRTNIIASFILPFFLMSTRRYQLGGPNQYLLDWNSVKRISMTLLTQNLGPDPLRKGQV